MPSSSADGLECTQSRGIERSDDQQDGVGAPAARLDDLVLVDDEILAQYRKVRGRARLLQELRRTLEILHVCQDRQTGRPAGGVTARDGGRVEVFAQHAS